MRGALLARRASLSVPTLAPLPTVGTAPAVRLMASSGVTLTSARVSAIADQTANARDAIQATALNQPVLVTDGYGRPVIRFSGPHHMKISGTTLDVRGHSVFAVFANHVLRAATTLGLGYGTGSSLNVGDIYDQAGATPGINLPGTLVTQGRWSCTPMIVGASCGNSSYKAWGNNFDAASYSPPGLFGSATGLRLGASGNGGDSGCGEFDLHELIVYPAALSQADSQVIVDYLRAKYAIGAPTKALVCEGDSITDGFGQGDVNNWPMQVARTGLPASWRVVNRAVAGSTMASMTSRASGTDSLRDSSLTTNVLHVLIGRNDLGTTAPTTEYANLKAYTSARAAAGWEVWVGTVVTGNTPSANDVTFNGLLRGSAGGGSGPGIVADSAGVARLVDYAAIAGLAGASQPSWWQSDKVHPSALGAGQMADLVFPLLT
jgi:lysophospholipase L1-like esterase